eukprot:395021-Pleurochrysis_carterae.AAC.1
MHTSCRLACGCPAACEDNAEWASHCPMWAQQGQCDDNAQFMSVHCRYSCRCPKPCLDRESFENCSAWRQAGECENNKPYMSRRCAATCGTCAMLDYTRTCPLPDRADAAVQPGMMKAMFERAVSNFPELEPSLLSADPPIVLFDAFLDEAEISSLLSYGEGRYERAMASGGRKEDEFIAVASEIRRARARARTRFGAAMAKRAGVGARVPMRTCAHEAAARTRALRAHVAGAACRRLARKLAS